MAKLVTSLQNAHAFDRAVTLPGSYRALELAMKMFITELFIEKGENNLTPAIRNKLD